MNKKGFTLIELLAVLVIVGLVASITIVQTGKLILKNKQRAYDIQVEFLENKAKEWSTTYVNILTRGMISGEYILPIQRMIDDGFIDQKELENPLDGSSMQGGVIVRYNGETYTYTYDKDCLEEEHPVTIVLGSDVYNTKAYGSQMAIDLTDYQSYIIGNGEYNYTFFACAGAGNVNYQTNTLVLGEITSDVVCTFANSLSSVSEEVAVKVLGEQKSNNSLEIPAGYKISLCNSDLTFDNATGIEVGGELKLKSSNVIGTGNTVVVNAGGKLEIESSKIISTNDSYSAVSVYGDANIKDTYAEGGGGISVQGAASKVEISDTNVLARNGYAVSINGSASSSQTLIKSGTFISKSGTSVFLNSKGTLTLQNEQGKQIYVSSYANKWAPVLRNGSTGTIIVTSTNRGTCTNDAATSTAGICVYCKGDITSWSSSSNDAVYNSNGGVINISGASLYGDHMVLYNSGEGSINVKNTDAISNYKAINNSNTGSINLCNVSVYGTSKDIKHTGTGPINYDADVTFKNGTNTPVVEGSGPVLSGYTGTCE